MFYITENIVSETVGDPDFYVYRNHLDLILSNRLFRSHVLKALGKDRLILASTVDNDTVSLDLSEEINQSGGGYHSEI